MQITLGTREETMFAEKIYIEESTDGVRLRVADGKSLVLIKNQSLGGNPCLFINKDYAKKHPEILEDIRTHTELTLVTNVEKKRLLGLLCGKVHAFTTSADFVGVVTASGFEATVKEARDGKLSDDLAVHPV